MNRASPSLRRSSLDRRLDLEALPSTAKIVVTQSSQTALGAILHHGEIKDSQGPGRWRRLKHFCLVYTLRGQTEYKDRIIGRRLLSPGDLLLIHPGVEHQYGGGGWDEYYMVFTGPLFDLWSRKHVLDPRAPVTNLAPVSYWRQRLEACALAPVHAGVAGNLRRLVNVLSFLTEAMEVRMQADAETVPEWLPRICSDLAEKTFGDSSLEKLARSCRLSVGRFRSAFHHAMGVTPRQYRLARIIERACELSRNRHRLQKEVASELGFATEQHFARHFKQAMGVTFSDFRRRHL